MFRGNGVQMLHIFVCNSFIYHFIGDVNTCILDRLLPSLKPQRRIKHKCGKHLDANIPLNNSKHRTDKYLTDKKMVVVATDIIVAFKRLIDM